MSTTSQGPAVCPVCSKDAAASSRAGGIGDDYECPKCGLFGMPRECADDLPAAFARLGEGEARARANLSGWIRRNQGITVTYDQVLALMNLPTPAFRSRVESLMQYLEEKTKSLDQHSPFGFAELSGVTSSITEPESDEIVM